MKKDTLSSIGWLEEKSDMVKGKKGILGEMQELQDTKQIWLLAASESPSQQEAKTPCTVWTGGYCFRKKIGKMLGRGTCCLRRN